MKRNILFIIIGLLILSLLSIVNVNATVIYNNGFDLSATQLWGWTYSAESIYENGGLDNSDGYVSAPNTFRYNGGQNAMWIEITTNDTYQFNVNDRVGVKFKLIFDQSWSYVNEGFKLRFYNSGGGLLREINLQPWHIGSKTEFREIGYNLTQADITAMNGGVCKLGLRWSSGYSGGFNYWTIDDVLVNNVKSEGYFVNGHLKDMSNNQSIPNCKVILQTLANNQELANTTSDNSGNFVFDMSALTYSMNTEYKILVDDNSYYASILTFEKPTVFTGNGSDKYYNVTMDVYPQTKKGTIFTTDSVTRSFVFPTNYYITDNEQNNYTVLVYSATGALTYDYIYQHHYTVIANVTSYFNKSVTVQAEVDNFIGYVEMIYSGNYQYDISGKTFTNDITPVTLGYTKVCWYYPNGTIMASTISDADGNYHIRSNADILADTYTIEGNFTGYANRTYTLFVPTDFIQKGTYDNNVYYLNDVNIYLDKAVMDGTAYAKFVIFNLFQQPLAYAHISLVSSNNTLYSYQADNSGVKTTPALPYDTYICTIAASGYQTSISQIVFAANTNGQTIVIKLTPNGWLNPTPTAIPNPSGIPTAIPTAIITPSPNPSLIPTATPVPNPYVPNGTGDAWNSLIDGYFESFGIRDSTTKGLLLGLIITLCCGLFGAGAAAYVSNGSSTMVIYIGVLFTIVGFIACTLLGFFPLWILLTFVVIICGLIAFLKFGQG